MHQEEQYAAWDLSTAVRRVSGGLAPHVLTTIQTRLALSDAELAHAVMMARRTLTRRRKQTRLLPDESERAYRLARLTEIAAKTLGGIEEARHWMSDTTPSLPRLRCS